MSRKIYLAISGTIFGSVAVAHLFRVVYQVSVHVGDQTFPMWLSWRGFAVADALCV
jgi:hypothetical protein